MNLDPCFHRVGLYFEDFVAVVAYPYFPARVALDVPFIRALHHFIVRDAIYTAQSTQFWYALAALPGRK